QPKSTYIEISRHPEISAFVEVNAEHLLNESSKELPGEKGGQLLLRVAAQLSCSSSKDHIEGESGQSDEAAHAAMRQQDEFWNYRLTPVRPPRPPADEVFALSEARRGSDSCQEPGEAQAVSSLGGPPASKPWNPAASQPWEAPQLSEAWRPSASSLGGQLPSQAWEAAAVSGRPGGSRALGPGFFSPIMEIGGTTSCRTSLLLSATWERFSPPLCTKAASYLSCVQQLVAEDSPPTCETRAATSAGRRVVSRALPWPAAARHRRVGARRSGRRGWRRHSLLGAAQARRADFVAANKLEFTLHETTLLPSVPYGGLDVVGERIEQKSQNADGDASAKDLLLLLFNFAKLESKKMSAVCCFAVSSSAASLAGLWLLLAGAGIRLWADRSLVAGVGQPMRSCPGYSECSLMLPGGEVSPQLPVLAAAGTVYKNQQFDFSSICKLRSPAASRAPCIRPGNLCGKAADGNVAQAFSTCFCTSPASTSGGQAGTADPAFITEGDAVYNRGDCWPHRTAHNLSSRRWTRSRLWTSSLQNRLLGAELHAATWRPQAAG
uniref:Ephrin_rec_like domain-containing protein n=1 Tax=Macrostomum lignano TaxID=282301 RepID=A0A1I8JPF8_9PLAT